MSDLVSGFASGFGRALPQGADFVQNREALRQRREQAMIQNQQAQQEMDMRKQQMDAAARQNGFKNMNDAISSQDAAITEYAGAIAEMRGRLGAPGSTVTPENIALSERNLQVMINNRNRLSQTANGILGQDVVQPLDQNAVLAQTEGPGFQEQVQTAAAQAGAAAAATPPSLQQAPGGSFNPRTGEFTEIPGLAEAQQRQTALEQLAANLGPVELGMRRIITQNPDGSFSTELVEETGGVVERERLAEEAAAEESARAEEVRAENLQQQIGDALTRIDEDFTATGLPGVLTAGLPGTPGFILANSLEAIRANLGFQQLQEIREASPTGGALGPVSDAENRLLQSTLGSLHVGLGEEELARNLQRIANALTQIRLGWDVALPYPEVGTNIPRSEQIRVLTQDGRAIQPSDIDDLSDVSVVELGRSDLSLSQAAQSAVESRLREMRSRQQSPTSVTIPLD